MNQDTQTATEQQPCSPTCRCEDCKCGNDCRCGTNCETE